MADLGRTSPISMHGKPLAPSLHLRHRSGSASSSSRPSPSIHGHSTPFQPHRSLAQPPALRPHHQSSLAPQRPQDHHQRVIQANLVLVCHAPEYCGHRRRRSANAGDLPPSGASAPVCRKQRKGAISLGCPIGDERSRSILDRWSSNISLSSTYQQIGDRHVIGQHATSAGQIPVTANLFKSPCTFQYLHIGLHQC